MSRATPLRSEDLDVRECEDGFRILAFGLLCYFPGILCFIGPLIGWFFVLEGTRRIQRHFPAARTVLWSLIPFMLVSPGWCYVISEFNRWPSAAPTPTELLLLTVGIIISMISLMLSYWLACLLVEDLARTISSDELRHASRTVRWIALFVMLIALALVLGGSNYRVFASAPFLFAHTLVILTLWRADRACAKDSQLKETD